MKLDHVSLSEMHDARSSESWYRIRAELKGIPGKQWYDGLMFVWLNSPFYLRSKSELTIKENVIELLIKYGNDIQNAIDTLSQCIIKADKMIRSSGTTYGRTGTVISIHQYPH
ncbi:MAG: hypothetical protein GX494_00400 [Clostridiaceae bacterium]|nr:hypothetical protein [Clostridiaceae bacterium]